MRSLPISDLITSDLVKAIILIVTMTGSIYLTVNMNYHPPPTVRQFSYRETIPASGSNIQVRDVSGRIALTRWSQAYVLINGTVAAIGPGASLDNVQIVEQNLGDIEFSATYSDKAIGRTYLVNVTLYIPATTSFTDVTLSAIRQGSITFDGINATDIAVTTEWGNIDMVLNPTRTGYYTISTYGSGYVSLNIPPTSSFKLTTGSGYDGRFTANGFDSCTVNTTPPPNAYPPPGPSVTCGDQSAIINIRTGTGGYRDGNITLNPP